MIPDSFVPYIAIGVLLALAGSFLAGNHHGHAAENLSWTALVAQQKADAQKLLADSQQRAREVESANADLSAQLEASRHETDVKTADADARVRDALNRVRPQRCGNSSSHDLPGGQTAGGAVNTPDGGDGGLSAKIDDDHANCARSANTLAAYVRECQAWAISVNHPGSLH